MSITVYYIQKCTKFNTEKNENIIYNIYNYTKDKESYIYALNCKSKMQIILWFHCGI